MKPTDAAAMILDFLQPNYKILKKGEYGTTFESRDKTHVGYLGSSSISFSHPTNKELQYVFGIGMMQRIKAFVAHPPSFNEGKFLKAQGSKPRAERSKSANGTPTPSARAVIFKLLGEGKTLEQILPIVVKECPDRTEKALKQQIYLHRSQFKKGMR